MLCSQSATRSAKVARPVVASLTRRTATCSRTETLPMCRWSMDTVGGGLGRKTAAARSAKRAGLTPSMTSGSNDWKRSSRATERGYRRRAPASSSAVSSRFHASPAWRRWAMKSSVTWCSATSVTYSSCCEMSCSSRSNGPSKFDSLTVNRPRDGSVGSAGGVSAGGCGGSLVMTQTPHEHRLLAMFVEVGQHHRDRLADYPAAVHGQAMGAAQRESGVLERQQLLVGHVHGDIRRVLLAGRAPPGRCGRGLQ